MADLVINKGDTSPKLTETIIDPATGANAVLTGATVTFTMRSLTATGPAINANSSNVTINSGGNGPSVTYAWTTTDTAVAGYYQGRFQVTTAGGAIYQWPTDGYLEILIEEDLVTPTPVGRLVTLGEVHDWLRLPAGDRVRDSNLIRLIDACTPVIEQLTGPIIQRHLFEVYDGGQWFLSLRYHPVVEVNMVAEYRGPIKYDLQQVPTPDLGTIYSYFVDFPLSRVIRRTVGGGITPFPPGPAQVFVDYTAGFASVPHNVRLATLELIRANYQPTQQGLHPAYGGAADQGEEIPAGPAAGFFVPWRVRELLVPNRRHPSVA